MRQLPPHMLKRAIRSLNAIAVLVALSASLGSSSAFAADRPKAPRPPMRLDEMTESPDSKTIESNDNEETPEQQSLAPEEQKPAPKPVVAPAPKPAPKPAPAPPAKTAAPKPVVKANPSQTPSKTAPAPAAGPQVREPQEAKPAVQPVTKPQTQQRSGRVSVPRAPKPDDRLRIFEDADDTHGPTIKNQEMSDEEAKEAMEETLKENCDDCKKKPTGGLLGPVVDSVKEIGESWKSSYDEEDFQTFKRRYENSNHAKCLESSMVGGIRVGRNLCYRAVKTALQRTHLVGKTANGRGRVYLHGEAASEALAVLQSESKTGGRPHINLMDQYKGKVNSRNAPIGSILVFRGPWIPLKDGDARAQQLPRCRGGRERWRNDCVFNEHGQLYIFRNYVQKSDGRKYFCSGKGTFYGHIEVRTTRGYSHFTETRRPIDEAHPGCRVLTGVMADPKVLDEDFDHAFQCPTGRDRMSSGARTNRGRRVR